MHLLRNYIIGVLTFVAVLTAGALLTGCELKAGPERLPTQSDMPRPMFTVIRPGG